MRDVSTISMKMCKYVLMEELNGGEVDGGGGGGGRVLIIN